VTTRAFTSEEIAALDLALAGLGRHRDRLLLLLLVATGYRITEILTVRVGQLVHPDGTIAGEMSIARRLLKCGRSKRAKSIRSRRVPLSGMARTAISDYISTIDEMPPATAFVFQSRKGVNSPISRGQAYKIVKSIARMVGLDADRLGCHSTRKAYAGGLYEATGHDIIKTQRLLGHASPLTTARYIDTDATELDNLVREFNPLAKAREFVAALQFPKTTLAAEPESRRV